MGLNVYVGSLARYYSHNWETLAQKAGAAPSNAVADPLPVQFGITQWRVQLLQSLQQAGSDLTTLDWNESLDAPYFTNTPGSECYGAVQILASHEEAAAPLFTSRYPQKLPWAWDEDARLLGATATVQGKYSHVLSCKIWLPADFEFPFHSLSPVNTPTRFGSTVRLVEQLNELNRCTYNGSAEDMNAWLRNPPVPPDRTFEPMAKTGLAMMIGIAGAANQNSLPMLLDY